MVQLLFGGVAPAIEKVQASIGTPLPPFWREHIMHGENIHSTHTEYVSPGNVSDDYNYTLTG